MAAQKIISHIALSNGSGVGISTVSSTSTSYVETTNPTYKYIDVADYNGATYYFEANFKTSAGTAYVSLHDTAGNVISGSEVTTTSTSEIRVRSSAISLTGTNTYTVRIKVTSGDTITYYASRIIVSQTSFTKTRTDINLLSPNGNVVTTASTSYVDTSSIGFSYFTFTSANWDGSPTYYLESTLKTSSGTASISLHTAAGVLVTNATCSTSSTSYVNVRSSTFTLTDATNYYIKIKTTSGTASFAHADVVILQPSSPTKAEKYYLVNQTLQGASAEEINFNGYINFDPTDFSNDTQTWYHEITTYANAIGHTFSIRNLTTGLNLANSTITWVTPIATNALARSSALTIPTSAADIVIRVNSLTGTDYVSACYLLGVLTWTNTTIGGGSMLLMFA